MVKKPKGRELNPNDAFRKAQRAKEVARNKKERALNREAQAHVDDPALLREQLREAIAAEQDGTSNPALRMRRKALQAAYEEAIRKQVEAETSSKTAPNEQRRPEDSVYYHPKLNPLGLPPPGKAQRWVTPAGNAPAAAVAKPKLMLEDIPLPDPPPLPPGPPPVLPPPPAPRMPAVIQGKSTVVSLPRAHEDKAVTSMVPASLLVQRPRAAPAKPKPKPVSSAGFGLLPRTVAAGTAPAAAAPKPAAPAAKAPNLDAKYDDFMASLRDMGAL